MRRILNLFRAGTVFGLTVSVVACGSEEPSDAAESARPEIVVTTNVLGDAVANAVGGLADVTVIMPVGVDPHDFAPSMRQAQTMENADLLVVNGAGYEESLLDVIEAVRDTGTEVFTFTDAFDLLDDDHDDDEHDDEHGDEHDDEHVSDGHGHEQGNPHFWTDPVRMSAGLRALEPVVAGLDDVDGAELAATFDSYVERVDALDSEIRTVLAPLPQPDRLLVTSHDEFGYFAERYGFRIAGTVVPSRSTTAEPSAAGIDGLASLMRERGVRAVFGDVTESAKLSDALAADVGDDVAVVELFSESLGEPGSGADTYVTMMRTDAHLVVDALTRN